MGLGSPPEVIPVSASAAWMPALNTWFERTMLPLSQRSRAALAETVAGDVQTLLSSLLDTLEKRSDPASSSWTLGQETEEVLRHMDGCLASFQQHWEKEFDRMLGWMGDIQGHAASILAESSAGAGAPSELATELLTGAITRATVGRFHAFLKEYGELTARLGADIDHLRASPNGAAILSCKLPGLSALPMPVSSPLHVVTIVQPSAAARTSSMGRTRHYRKELEEKTTGSLRQILEEYQPRFGRWFLVTMQALKESLRRQTDSLRYRSPASASAETDERLIADIAFLRSHQT